MANQLQQQAVRHSVYTQRYAGHLANLFDPYIERLISEMELILFRGPETTLSKRRIDQLIAEYKKAALVIYGEYNEKFLFAEFQDFAFDESEWAVDNLKAAIKAPVTFVIPTSAQVWAAVNSSPLVFPGANGVKLLDPFIKDWESSTINEVSKRIRTGFITGRTSQQIAQDIAGKNGYLDKQNRAAIKTMVRTATNYLSTVARNKTNDDNSDILDGYEISATLDGRTTPYCRAIDDTKVFNNGLIIWGSTGKKEKTNYKPKPPFHAGCRDTIFPILKPEYAIDESDAMRASVGPDGGKQVNAKQKGYLFLQTQGRQGAKGRAFVQDAIGVERANLLIDGGMTAQEFSRLTLDEVFRPIPLKELRKKKPLQLAFDSI